MKILTGNRFSGLVMLMIGCLFGFGSLAAESRGGLIRDTTIIAKNEESFKIDSNKPFFQATLHSTGKKVVGNRKISLVLEDLKLKENADGVYEIYVSLQPYTTSELNPKKSSFANFLNLQSMTEQSSKRTLTVDITRNVSRWVKDGGVSPHLVITILFRGNNESSNKGKLGVEGLRIVQEN
jgi:hypothetical protein